MFIDTENIFAQNCTLRGITCIGTAGGAVVPPLFSESSLQL
jgi:hypothetical protein